MHELKTWPEYYAAVADGRKNFEVRKNDRDFEVGDFVNLREWNPKKETYSGKSTVRCITYILPGGAFGVEYGYCVLGLQE